jgi:hypothetical protein
MAYADEDEIDWSDGSLDAPSHNPIETIARSIQPSPLAEIHNGQDPLLLSGTHDQYQIPCGFPLEPGKSLGLNGNRLLTI